MSERCHAQVVKGISQMNLSVLLKCNQQDMMKTPNVFQICQKTLIPFKIPENVFIIQQGKIDLVFVRYIQPLYINFKFKQSRIQYTQYTYDCT